MKRINFRNCSIYGTLICVFFALSVKGYSQSTSSGETPQFLFNDFSDGIIRMKNGSIQKTVLNYNLVSEKVVYQKDGNLFDLIGLDLIDTVLINESVFIPVEGVFYEVLYVAPVSLFLQWKGSIIPPGKPAGYGGTSQVSNTKMLSSVELNSGYYNIKLPNDYTVNVEKRYWLRSEGSMTSFINERQFLKLYPTHEEELKNFIKKNKIKFEKETDVVKIIAYINGLSK